MGAHQVPFSRAVVPVVQDVTAQPTDWRQLALDTKRRLEIAEEKLTETAKSADEMRGRMQKYKARLDTAQSENNRLQAQVVELSQRCEEQSARIARQDAAKRKLYEFRQSVLEGPLWEAFQEL